MRYIFLIIFIFETTLAAAVVNAVEVTQDPVMVKIAENVQGQEAVQGIDKKEYQSKRYTVKEETDVVERALNVFKNKSKPSSLYRKRIWLYGALQDSNASYLSFTTNDQNANIVFSPDEEFVYYIEMAPDGTRRLNGVMISSQEKFFINTADSFYIETCDEGQTSYVIVTDGTAGTYSVFNLNGTAVTLPDMPADINDLKNVICY